MHMNTVYFDTASAMNYQLNPGDTIQIGTHEVDAPDDVERFLRARGWTQVSPRWQHSDKNRFFMTWEQAMALEFYEFITIGGVPR
jgi:hypothetical protein